MLDGFGAGLIITNPEGIEFTYALRFMFDVINNEAEYEAMIVGLRIAEQMGVKNLQANVDSRLVANQAETTFKQMKKVIAKLPTLTAPKEKEELIIYLAAAKEAISAVLMMERDGKKCLYTLLAVHYKARLDERSKNWLEEISHDFWAHRIMISNGEMPFLLMYGTKAVILVEIGMPTFRTAKGDMIKNNEALEINLDLLEERREQAARILHQTSTQGREQKSRHAKQDGIHQLRPPKQA
nr:reverse transcriptase domain-containing protein [Tanacetum cinerariifolium]